MDPFLVSSLPTISVAPSLFELGNLTILVGSNEQGQPMAKYKVIQENLCLASPAFNAKLKPNGPWKKSAASLVSFRDDNAAAFEIVLRILHRQSTTLPEKLTFDTLLGLAVLAGKYDLLHIVLPVVPRWISDFEKAYSTKSYPADEVIFVTWVFGLHDLFKTTLLEIALHCKPMASGGLGLSEQRMNSEYLLNGLEGKHSQRLPPLSSPLLFLTNHSPQSSSLQFTISRWRS